ncbi:MAG TPA: hypothetical protein VHD55_01360 [Candidatus Paceibacterota bacterium]|nr:hypothetical protein [Candidatus Paceibacterota bacterium]
MNNSSNVNTILIVVVLVLLVGGGVWWYKTYGPGAAPKDGGGLNIQIGGDSSQ